jgi:predicted metalloprotease
VKVIASALCALMVLSGCVRSIEKQPTYDEAVHTTITLLQSYWPIKLSLLPDKFTPPPIYVYDSPDDLECNGKPAKLNNATWCAVSQRGAYIGFDIDFMTTGYTEFGPMFVYFIFSHEYAHAVQWHVQQRHSDIRSFELQADCLAGAFMAEMFNTGNIKIKQRDMVYIQPMMYNLGDDGDGRKVPADPTKGHGTGAERYSNFYAGFTRSVQACDLRGVS